MFHHGIEHRSATDSKNRILSMMTSSLRIFALAFMIFLAKDSCAKLPGQLYLDIRGGMSFPGIASQGSGFIGRNFAGTATYIPLPDTKVGAQISLGIESQAFRHYFDERVFVEHAQRGITSDICASMSVGNRMHFLVGINVFLPFYREVDMGEKNYNEVYFYSNTTLMSTYTYSPVQASAVVGFDCSLGKKSQSHFGLRVAQAGISPVREDVYYNDATGDTIVLSRRMKPIAVQLSFSVRIVLREKRKEKLIESE